jgi:NitT/TauT family transport system substrate-binding protein
MTRRSYSILAGCLLVAAGVGAFAWYKNHENRVAPFHVAFNEWVGFAPLFLARDLGYFGDLPVEFDFVAVEGDKRAGLYAGRFDMICETADMFQTNRDSTDFPGKIIFVIDESFGGDGVVASDKVASVKDLRGKTVVAEPGQPAYFALQYLLNKEGMKLKDLDVQHMNSTDAAAAFIAGKADVAGTYEPFLTQALQKRAGSHVLASSKDLPGLIVDVGVVRQQTLENRQKDLETLVAGWFRAVDYFKQNPTDATARMAKAFKLSPKEFTDTIGGLRYLDRAENLRFLGKPGERGTLFQTFDTIGTVLKDNQLTAVTVPATSRIDNAIVGAVTAAGNAH